MKPHHPQETPESEPPDYVPSSPVKRTLAWIGLSYAILFLLLTTYFYYTGSMLGNLAPLLALPGLIGMGILSLVSWRTTGKPGRWGAILLAVLCWVLALVTVPLALAGFLSNFGG